MKLSVEGILLFAFFGLLMWLSLGVYFDHQLSHDFPTGYGVSDAYQHQVRAEWVKDAGNYAHEAPYTVGNYQNVVGYYMPGTSMLVGLLSEGSGLQSYDALLLLVNLAAALSAIVMYFVIKKFNTDIALLSIPVMTLYMTGNFYGSIILGQFPFIMGSLFLISSMWALSRLHDTRGILYIALFVAAIIINHTSEFFFIVGLMGIAGILAISSKDWKGVFRLGTAGVLAGIIGIYYFFIFTFTWGAQFGYKFYVEHQNPGYGSFRVFTFEAFPFWILILMMIGLAYLILRNKEISIGAGIVGAIVLNFLADRAVISNDGLQVAMWFGGALLVAAYVIVQRPHIVKSYAPYMIMIGYASLVGFGPRAHQTRFMWPITLGILFGAGLYVLLESARKQYPFPRAAAVLGVTIVLTLFIVATNYDGFTNPGTMTQERWDMIEFLQENGDEETRVLFFYGDGYEQTPLLYNAKHFSSNVPLQGYVDFINNQEPLRDVPYGNAADWGPAFPYWKGLGFGYHLHENNHSVWNEDACLFEYYVLDKVTFYQQLQPVIQTHAQIAQQMVNAGMEVAFENQVSIVIRNPNVGGDCFA